MSKIKSENYIVIQGFMIKDLNLKGNELLIYAIIYGFSQEENQKFNGSLQYLADWTNSTKQSVLKNIKSLIKKGYIIKEEKIVNNIKFCEYYTTKFNSIKKSLTNNININNNNNIYISNISEKKFNSSKKSTYGKYKNILLTDKQLEQLKQEYSNYEELIDRLDKGIETYGYKYNNHYLAIKAWEQNKKEQYNKEKDKNGKMCKHTYTNLNEFYI